MNAVNIVGRLVKDPEIRKTEDGMTVCDMKFAIADTYSKDARTDFVMVTTFGNKAENCEKYLRKGLMAGITGRIRSDFYTDADGIKRYPVKIIADRIKFVEYPDRGMEAPAEEPAYGPEQDDFER